MATLDGRKLTNAEHNALKKKWAAEDKKFWSEIIKGVKNRIVFEKKKIVQLQKVKNPTVVTRIKISASKLRIADLTKQLNNLKQ